MKIWEFGLVTEPFEAVASGKKTIEGRLKKGKFAEMRAGDTVKIRRDYRDENGVIHDGEPDAARVEIVAVRRYEFFADMVLTEGYEKVASSPVSAGETIASYDEIYSLEDQKSFGVLAIEVKILSVAV